MWARQASPAPPPPTCPAAPLPSTATEEALITRLLELETVQLRMQRQLDLASAERAHYDSVHSSIGACRGAHGQPRAPPRKRRPPTSQMPRWLRQSKTSSP